MSIELNENEKIIFKEAGKNCYSIGKKSLKEFVEEFQGLKLSEHEFDVCLAGLKFKNLISIHEDEDGFVWIGDASKTYEVAEQLGFI